MSNDGDVPMPESEVGYRKPPKGSRFKKGQSGNLKGRPRTERSKRTLDIMREELFRVVTIGNGEEAERGRVIDFIVRNQILRASKGDVQALGNCLRLLVELEAHSPEIAAASKADMEVRLAAFKQHLDEMAAIARRAETEYSKVRTPT